MGGGGVGSGDGLRNGRRVTKRNDDGSRKRALTSRCPRSLLRARRASRGARGARWRRWPLPAAPSWRCARCRCPHSPSGARCPAPASSGTGRPRPADASVGPPPPARRLSPTPAVP
eukprot:1194669-Prorocentrum_minimum.AAC.1